MAYRCKRNQMKECDGCGYCQPERPPETGVTITATIKLKFTVYGEIETMLRNGEDVVSKAEEMVDDMIDCCGITANNMSVEDIEYNLNE